MMKGLLQNDLIIPSAPSHHSTLVDRRQLHCRQPAVQLLADSAANKKPASRRVLPVPKEGFEPSRGNPHYALNVARLPIPPLRPAPCILSQMTVLSTIALQITT